MKRIVAMMLVVLMLGMVMIGVTGCFGIDFDYSDSDDRSSDSSTSSSNNNSYSVQSNKKFSEGDIVYVQCSYESGSKCVYWADMPEQVDESGWPIGLDYYKAKRGEKLRLETDGFEVSRGIPGARNPIFYMITFVDSGKPDYESWAFINQNLIGKTSP